jgi:hypothetical protein
MRCSILIYLLDAATSKLVQLMHVHQSAGCKSVRSYFGEFCLEIMKGCTRSEYKRSLLVIFSLESALSAMPGTVIAKICSQSLQLQACGQPLLTAAVYRMLDSLFQSQSKSLSATTAVISFDISLQAIYDAHFIYTNYSVRFSGHLWKTDPKPLTWKH